MKFLLFITPTIPATFEERERLRPIGRNNEKYQEMLTEVREIAQLADEVGFDVLSTTEHHFHSEGFEISVAPLLLYADLAARTERIKFSPLGLVLPSWDPLRVAEELAMLDHLTKGRIYGGFARGFQDRWLNVMGQHTRVRGTPMDGSATDDHNRSVYEEYMKIVKMAWTQETIDYNGQYYQVPFPYEQGITRWPAQEWTKKYGAPGELDENGVIRRVSVVPAPYQQPHPPLMQPFSLSEKTIRYTARENITPWILGSRPEKFVDLCRAYQQTAAEHGRDLKLGEGVGAMRSLHFADTPEELYDITERTTYAAFNEYLGDFGFWEAFRLADDDEKYPGRMLPKSEWTVQRMFDSQYALGGTPEQVRSQVAEVASCYGNDGELSWFGLYVEQGLMPLEETKKQLRLFGEHVISHYR
ncbi:LLM class flavin-dependent oxidoreductase [Streptomyces sp. NPDC048196]|uniref:LLM class flavin-dependent oxidoreductase n=1 Tax=Streptomyces sp. NPDC048196 TaxID=3154712 RepID=UPI0033E5EC52